MSCQIANAYETVGHERVMFGIDSPFHHPTVEIQKVMACGVAVSYTHLWGPLATRMVFSIL